MGKGSGASANISQLKVGEFVDLISPLYVHNEPKKIPAIMLWGPPGIGKSKSIEAVAETLKKSTGKDVIVHDIRLSLFNPVDLRGIPVADSEKKFAIWLKPFIFQMDASPDKINIVMLDEISAVAPSVQVAAYQLVLDRKIGEHSLPDNCIVMAAGNRVTDKSVSYKMSKALSNRFSHLEIACDVEDWKKWAIPAGIDSRIIAFLNYMPSKLFLFDPSNDDNAFPTPRSWEMVNTYLNIYTSIDKAFPLIAGSIGLGCTTEFVAWTKVFHKLPDINSILEGKDTMVPEEPDVLYALSAALTSALFKAKEKSKEQTTQLRNVLKYILKMPAEFATLTVKDIITVESLRMSLVKVPEWPEFAKKYKGLIM